MKKLISIIVICLILTSAVIVEQIYLNNTFSTLKDKIQNVNQQVISTETIDSPEILQYVNDLQTYWDSVQTYLSFTINYNDLQRVGEQIKRVKSYIKQNQKEDCVAEISVLLYYAENYQIIYIINFTNVF